MAYPQWITAPDGRRLIVQSAEQHAAAMAETVYLEGEFPQAAPPVTLAVPPLPDIFAAAIGQQAKEIAQDVEEKLLERAASLCWCGSERGHRGRHRSTK